MEERAFGVRQPLPDATDLLEALDKEETTAREALEGCLERIDALNGEVNAIVLLDSDGARKRADLCDRDRRAGRRHGQLQGLPVTLKECFDWAGQPTTWGDPRRTAARAEEDSTVVRRLRQEGAVLVGKTNIPAYLGDWETSNPLFGATRNPHDRQRSAGGSSGGSAAAVASGMSYADIGSDQGGSIRLPAHYCGVFGLKPTWGLIPLRGHSPLGEARAPDIGVAGPLTRSARDAALFLRVLAGPDDRSGPWQLRLPAADKRPLNQLTIAVMLDDPQCPLDRAYLQRLEMLVAKLEKAGAVIETARPAIDLVRHSEAMNLMVRAETSTKAPLKESLRQALRREPAMDTEPPPAFAALNAAGTALSHHDWLGLHEERLGFARRWQQFFARYDLLLCPAAASAAPPFRQFDDVSKRTIPINGVERPVLEQHFWYGLASLCGLPAISLPIGTTSDGLPAGVQAMAATYADLTLCAWATQIWRAAMGQ